MITVVITSCGRPDLLKTTMMSFMKYNTYSIERWIVVDDSGDEEVFRELRATLPFCTLILNPVKRGQIACIDDAYSHVDTPFIFHCEDDYEFLKGGFIEQSLDILTSKLKIMQVWLFDGNNHPIKPEVLKAKDTEYRILGDDSTGRWHGFTWNPGLRRLSDYKRVAPFTKWIEQGDFNALTERRIGEELYRLGYSAAILNDNYCKHIGHGRHIG